MTKPEARRKLMDIIAAEGVNTPQHLERALEPAVTFNYVADAWESKRLPQLKPSTQYTAPILDRKYLRPFFGQMAPQEIKTGAINDWIADLESKGLRPKTVHNLWKQFRAIMNWHAQQNDEPKRAWYPTLPTIPEDERVGSLRTKCVASWKQHKANTKCSFILLRSADCVQASLPVYTLKT
jgi:hypothetical protein